MKFLRALREALTLPTPYWLQPIPEEPEPDPRAHLVCGVVECADGYVAFEAENVTVIECDTHNARTTHDTVVKERGTQQIIRVQDKWRQHGSKSNYR